MRLAAVEGGGTTFVAAIAEGSPTNIVEREEWPTTNPAETIGRVADWLAARSYDRLGIACFGPVDLNRNSPTYGYITTTPKAGWRYTDVLGPLSAVRPVVPCAFDTDVNGPALGEYRHARAHGSSITSCAYITVGTGIGVGLVVRAFHDPALPLLSASSAPPPRRSTASACTDSCTRKAATCACRATRATAISAGSRTRARARSTG